LRSADGGQESPDHSTCLAGGEILRPVALPCGCCLRSDSSGVPRAHDFPPLFCTPEPSAPETYHDVPSNTLTCPLTCREGWTAGSSPPVTRRPLRAGRSRVVRRFRPVPFASRRSTFRLLMVAPSLGCALSLPRGVKARRVPHGRPRSPHVAKPLWRDPIALLADRVSGSKRRVRTSRANDPIASARGAARRAVRARTFGARDGRGSCADGPKRKKPRSARHTGYPERRDGLGRGLDRRSR
jgi:hypothetical protein